MTAARALACHSSVGDTLARPGADAVRLGDLCSRASRAIATEPDRALDATIRHHAGRASVLLSPDHRECRRRLLDTASGATQCGDAPFRIAFNYDRRARVAP